MFSLKSNNKFRKESQRTTRTVDKYVFETDIVHMDIYAKSPYMKGVSLWNMLTYETQAITDRYFFRNTLRKNRALN